MDASHDKPLLTPVEQIAADRIRELEAEVAKARQERDEVDARLLFVAGQRRPGSALIEVAAIEEAFQESKEREALLAELAQVKAEHTRALDLGYDVITSLTRERDAAVARAEAAEKARVDARKAFYSARNDLTEQVIAAKQEEYLADQNGAEENKQLRAQLDEARKKQANTVQSLESCKAQLRTLLDEAKRKLDLADCVEAEYPCGMGRAYCMRHQLAEAKRMLEAESMNVNVLAAELNEANARAEKAETTVSVLQSRLVQLNRDLHGARKSSSLAAQDTSEAEARADIFRDLCERAEPFVLDALNSGNNEESAERWLDSLDAVEQGRGPTQCRACGDVDCTTHIVPRLHESPTVDWRALCERMVETLHSARATFENYAQMHYAKRTEEGQRKGGENQRRAETMQRAIADYEAAAKKASGG